ncbi:hypothetical protein [Pseudoxanthomonas sp. GM95]|uniref:hypothetical protein n=1 Tax=Pseudoxanthomonas sp. GM95 TaxID=1881043 RepID=UPI000B2840FC|nr:hypothetical protein [Pseudoxanthomonas sp. GM95]
MHSRTPAPPRLKVLPYRALAEGKDYWIIDDLLPDAAAVRARCLRRDDWIEGYPHKPESWPGLRTLPGLEPDELALVEDHVRRATGAKRLWMATPPAGATPNHNCVQVVGVDESQARPHTDARSLCKYAPCSI